MISKDAAAEMLSRTALFGPMEADQRRAVVQEMREISFDALATATTNNFFRLFEGAVRV